MSGAAAKRGLSDADRLEIERLALAMNKPTPSKIARRIGADVGTVNWFMIRNSLVERTVRYGGPIAFVRNGITYYRYQREHDERICELRREGKNGREIAAIISTEFGIKRSGHSVDVRLTMLGAYEGGPEP